MLRYVQCQMTDLLREMTSESISDLVSYVRSFSTSSRVKSRSPHPLLRIEMRIIQDESTGKISCDFHPAEHEIVEHLYGLVKDVASIAKCFPRPQNEIMTLLDLEAGSLLPIHTKCSSSPYLVIRILLHTLTQAIMHTFT